MADLNRLSLLADPRIRKIWDQKNSQLSSRLEYSKLGFTDWNTEIPDPQFENFTGLGIAQATAEKEAYNREEIDQARNVTISPEKFTKAADISEEMLRFNQWPRINNIVGAAAKAVNARIDTNAAKIYYL